LSATLVTCPNCGRRNRVRPQAEGIPRCGVCHAPLPWIVDASTEEFDAEVQAKPVVLVDLWAPWCGPCKWIEPLVEELARSHAGKLKVVRVNIDAAPAVADRYGVRAVPTLLVIRDGDEVDRLAGAAPKQQFETWLARHLPTAAAAS
jgi:thioredoxin 2